MPESCSIYLVQVYLSIIPRAAAVSQQLTQSPRLLPRVAHWPRREEDNVAV